MCTNASAVNEMAAYQTDAVVALQCTNSSVLRLAPAARTHICARARLLFSACMLRTDLVEAFKTRSDKRAGHAYTFYPSPKGHA